MAVTASSGQPVATEQTFPLIRLPAEIRKVVIQKTIEGISSINLRQPTKLSNGQLQGVPTILSLSATNGTLHDEVWEVLKHIPFTATKLLEIINLVPTSLINRIEHLIIRVKYITHFNSKARQLHTGVEKFPGLKTLTTNVIHNGDMKKDAGKEFEFIQRNIWQGLRTQFLMLDGFVRLRHMPIL
jgi:hypothetical protein